MCYYSKTMNTKYTRDAKDQENLTLVTDHSGHKMAKGDDGKVVCVMNNSTMHIENFQVDKFQFAALNPNLQMVLKKYIGKSVSAPFVEYNGSLISVRRGYASDAILLDGVRIHIIWLAEGLKCYVGTKKISLETKLGVDDPSIALDHKEETPTVARTLARIAGLCSITR